MCNDIKTDVCVPVYDRPTTLADDQEICHGCGQTYDRVRDGSPDHNFCWFCAPAPDQVRDGTDWTDDDVLATLTVVYDNEAMAILRMAQA